VLIAMASRVDLFTIWVTVLLAIGIHVLGKIPKQQAYIAAGITTDHECFTKEEALDKVAAGCKISIRKGSAARNFDALYTLLGEYPGQTMLCSDDKHPDELLDGHINKLVRRAVERGIDLFDALRAACITPVEHYKLPVGQLRVGDAADFIEVDSLEGLNVIRTWVGGQLVAENGQTTIPRVEPMVINNFTATKITPEEIDVSAPADSRMNGQSGDLAAKRRHAGSVRGAEPLEKLPRAEFSISSFGLISRSPGFVPRSFVIRLIS